MMTHKIFAAILVGLVWGCEPPPDETNIELVGCIDTTQPWKTCAEFCEWDGAVCAEAGCSGFTARSFRNEHDCITDGTVWPWVESPVGCNDILSFEADPSSDLHYYDCCCDYG